MQARSSFRCLIVPARASQPADFSRTSAYSPKRRRRFSKGVIFFSLVTFVALTGCFPIRQTPPEARPPKQVVTHYLRSVFKPSMQRDVHDLLTARAKAAIPYRDFVFLRNGEVSHIVGSRRASDTRISVSVLDQYDFSDAHSVVYALLYIRYPYSLGEMEAYRLVRLHCWKEGDQWAIEPFMHAETSTVIFVPTRMRGPLWRISRDMERVAALVRDEIAGYDEEKAPSSEKPVAETQERQPAFDVPRHGEPGDDVEGVHADSGGPETTAIPSPMRVERPSRPVVPDALMAEGPKPSSQGIATEKKLSALLSIGKLCYEAGKIDAAADTFGRVLVFDPENVVAKDYLSRCANYRLLQKEKEEAVRLMEELLRLDSQKRSEK